MLFALINRQFSQRSKMNGKKRIGPGVVKHWTPGRLRIALSPLVGNKPLSRRLENAIVAKKSVIKSRARPASGSLVIWYDPTEFPRERLLDDIDRHLKDFFDRSFDNAEATEAFHANSRSFAKTIRFNLVGAAFLGFFLIYSLYRKLFRSPLSQRAGSVAGIIAVFATIPLAIEAFREQKRKKRSGLFMFLTGACVLSIFTGNALTALEIVWLLSIGTLLEKLASEKAARAVRESLEVAPDKTFVLKDGAEVEIFSADLEAGDVVTAYVGDKIPADGVVTEGEALVDESRLTGRWEPVRRSSGNPVFAGSKIVQGSLHVRAEKTGEQTRLRRMLVMVERSLENRSESERAADELARRLTKLGAVSTVVTLILTRNVSRSLSVLLVMACPCAAVLAASTAVAAAIARAARSHILIKDGRYLEKAGSVDILCFDKTGTITTDMPELADIATRTPNQDPDRILAMAAAAETKSRHPAAKALLSAASARKLEIAHAPDPVEFPGRGVSATVGEDAILVGNHEFMISNDVNPSYFKTKSRNFMDAGKTVLYVARNEKLQGMIALENTFRPGADAVLHKLRRHGVKEIHLISGDHRTVVDRICAALRFDACEADMVPEEKAAYVEKLVKDGHAVMMVGDGVNDAPAFAKADIGAAFGAAGSETALEAADVVFLSDDLDSIATLRKLSARTLKTVEINFRIAVLTDVLGILLGAAGLLAPGTSGILHIIHAMGIFYNSGRILKE
jgi:cation-transporting P-type ATPase C